jgi:large subunit ribosomal protein L29
MKASELRQKNIKDLKKVESDFHREIFNLNMQKATGQLSKPDQIRKIRRNIARVYTVMTAMEKQV